MPHVLLEAISLYSMVQWSDIVVEGMDAPLGHVADDEIPDRHVVDVLVVRAERRLRVVARRPAAAVQDRAVLADERIAPSSA